MSGRKKKRGQRRVMIKGKMYRIKEKESSASNGAFGKSKYLKIRKRKNDKDRK